MKKLPQEARCWFCNTDDISPGFDIEFHTYVHEKCIKLNLNNPEAK